MLYNGVEIVVGVDHGRREDAPAIVVLKTGTGKTQIVGMITNFALSERKVGKIYEMDLKPDGYYVPRGRTTNELAMQMTIDREQYEDALMWGGELEETAKRSYTPGFPK